MNIFGNTLSYVGLQIIEAPAMVIGPFEDWSAVRSPGRARRRRRQGHPQRIRQYYKPDPKVLHDKVHGVIYAHPATVDALRKAIPTTNPNR